MYYYVGVQHGGMASPDLFFPKLAEKYIDIYVYIYGVFLDLNTIKY